MSFGLQINSNDRGKENETGRPTGSKFIDLELAEQNYTGSIDHSTKRAVMSRSSLKPSGFKERTLIAIIAVKHLS